MEIRVKNFIKGEYREASSYIDNFNPTTGKSWGSIPDSGEDEIEAAVCAALEAFPSWSSTPAEQRSAVLMKIADILESRLDEFAELESRDQGKPVWLAKNVEIPRAVYNFRFFASYILHDINRSHVLDAAGAVNYTVKQPVGVAGLISPWNLPLYLLTFKIAPAIATGNTVVAKPSEMTSVTAFKLCEVFAAAGLPPGVVNIVFGLGKKAGQALVAHPRVPIISFTGSTATAKKLRETASYMCKKFSLELGGKNPAVIFDDADLDSCISTTIRSSFLNQGEICLCTSRIFVQKRIFDKFLEKFVERAKKLQVGDPSDASTFMGPLISVEHLNKVRGFVKRAKSDGATIHCGEGVDELNLNENIKDGYFIRPTVISDVSDESPLMKEEIFGPVTCVVPFDTEEEVIQRANDVDYGLSATVWTKDIGIANRVAAKIHAGTVWVNCWLVRDLNMPFGGVKQSGIGRESAKDSVEFYTEEKTVCLKY